MERVKSGNFKIEVDGNFISFHVNKKSSVNIFIDGYRFDNIDFKKLIKTLKDNM